MRKTLKLFYVLTLFYSTAFGFKILLYNPKFAQSHVTFTGKLADTLAAAGHDVVIYQPEFNENITITGSKNKNVRVYSMPRDPTYEPDFTVDSVTGNLFEEESFSRKKAMATNMNRIKSGLCELILNDDKNFQKMKAENFDLGITELFESCGYGVFKKIGLEKYITTYSSSVFPSSVELLGVKAHPSYLPGIMGTTTDQMNFPQRIWNFINYFIESWMVKAMFMSGSEKAIGKHYSGFSMNDAVADSAFYFVNSDEHVDFAQPITHKIIYMAGLGKIQSQPLEKKYTDIFDSAKKGVILFSFGSVAQSVSMKPEMKKAFLEAFAEFPDINFLWKYEKDEDQITKGYKNVFTGKWLPQNDILDHPKLLAFISHGGMNSVMEGAAKGVPMICVPLFADQNRNSLMLQRRGMAIKLEKSQITKENIVKNIKEIISNEKYRKNAKILSKMIGAKPTKAEERVVKYAEFAAQFGDTGTLQIEGRYQSFFVLYSLDVISFLVTVTALSVAVLIWAVKKALNSLKQKLLVSDKKKRN
uniref:UDP-glucuronosyltransferase n=1 Tax=Panagrolaimus sp. PS1159 TaxID=55785 RepID=A0AC35F1Y0_9BILA